MTTENKQEGETEINKSQYRVKERQWVCVREGIKRGQKDNKHYSENNRREARGEEKPECLEKEERLSGSGLE